MSPAQPFRPTVAEIDLDALVGNFAAFRALAPAGEFICPMVKANAYGHGDVGCARALREAGSPHLGVALFEEGARLREAGDAGSILVFGPFDARAAREARALALTPVVGSLEQLRALVGEWKTSKAPAPIHLEFNTGMNRLGLEPQEAAAARALIDASPWLKLEGVCTHLRTGEDAGDLSGESARQFAAFEQALASFRGLAFTAHALNSSGALNFARVKAPGAVQFGLRPGIALYGAQPPTTSGARLELRAPMTLKSQIVQLRRLNVGERVSYDGTWEAKRPSLIGVLPAGYADGYFRALSNKGSALVRGRRAPIAGTVCMDYLMLDLTEIERATGEIPLGEPAVLLGKQSVSGEPRRASAVATITAEELASAVGTIPYEIFTSISARVPRVFIK